MSRSFIEWAVRYDHGTQEVDDEEQAIAWQKDLPQPNTVVYRVVTRSEWEEATEAECIDCGVLVRVGQPGAFSTCDGEPYHGHDCSVAAADLPVPEETQ